MSTRKKAPVKKDYTHLPYTKPPVTVVTIEAVIQAERAELDDIMSTCLSVISSEGYSRVLSAMQIQEDLDEAIRILDNKPATFDLDGSF